MHSLFLLPLILLLAYTSQALAEPACPGRVDPKKAIVFYDLNASYREVMAAHSAACARGERLVVYPHGYDKAMVIGKSYEVLFGAQKRANSCQTGCHRKGTSPEQCSASCKPLIEAKNKANDAYLAARRSVGSEERYKQIDTKKHFKELADGGVKITSLVLSGHNGGNSYSGLEGQFDANLITNSITEAYKGKEDLLKDFNNVALWGCYTATVGGVMIWKSAFPSLKVIAGYSGSAPSGVRPISGEYLKDLLIKSSQLPKVSTLAEAQVALKSIKGVNETLSAIYTQCDSCKQEWYMGTETTDSDQLTPDQRPQRTITRKVEALNRETICESIGELVGALNQQLVQFMHSKESSPTDTTNHPLRRLYNQARQYEHCPKMKQAVNAEKVGLLLFFKGVLENFNRVFETEIDESIAELESINLAELLKGKFSSETEYQAKLAAAKKALEDFEKTPEAKRLQLLQQAYGAQTDDLDQKNIEFEEEMLSMGIYGQVFEFNLLEMSGRELEADPAFREMSSEAKAVIQSTRAVIAERDAVSKKYEADVQPLRGALKLQTELRAQLNTLQFERQNGITSQALPAIAEMKARVVNSLKDFKKDPSSTTRAQVNQMAKNFQNLLSNQGLGEISDRLVKTKKLSELAEKYLVHLDVNCMDFLEWHEAGETRPTARCR
jgi:hypothetical protein